MDMKEFKFKLDNVKTRKLSLLHDKDDNSLQVLVDGKVMDKESDPKTKADMERTLKSYLPVTPQPKPPARR